MPTLAKPTTLTQVHGLHIVNSHYQIELQQHIGLCIVSVLAAGVFTAPVKGVYYFSFSGHNQSTRSMGLTLCKNDQPVVMGFNHAAGNRYETVTNGMNLELEIGDRVYIRLSRDTWVFDNANKHSTFIGHLLFPL